MKKLILLLAMGAWMVTFAQVDRDQLSLDISKADAANTEQLKAFIWKKASVVTVDGAPLFRFDFLVNQLIKLLEQALFQR